MEDKNAKKTKGSAYTQPDYIKPKSKWSKKATIWTIVIAVIVLGILAIIGANNGWFKTQDMINGKAELDDYSVLEINESDVEVTDDTLQSYLDNVVSAETVREEVTEGTVETGDIINLDYSGVLAGEEEPFEGGTAQGQSLTLGSGTMIEGFEDQIAGHEIGETFDINVTFPEDYATADLAGKDAVFTITINSKTESTVPELTDELIQTYSEEHMDETLDSIEAFKDYYRTTLSESRLETAILNAMAEKTHVKYYNEADLANLKTYNLNAVSYYGNMFGTDAAGYASMMGYDSADAYAEAESKRTLDQTMMLDIVAADQGITVTDEEINEKLNEYMENENFDGTLDEFKEQSGPAFLFLISKTEVLQPKVLEYLKQNVVMVESEETEESADAAEENTEAAEETTEAVEETTKAEEETTTKAEEETTTKAEKETTTKAEEETTTKAEKETTTKAEKETTTKAEKETTTAEKETKK